MRFLAFKPFRRPAGFINTRTPTIFCFLHAHTAHLHAHAAPSPPPETSTGVVMAPVGNPSLFMRFFGLVENYPLYAMVGIACGLAAYTPIRHLTNAADIALDTRARAYGDNLAENPRYLEKSKHYYDYNTPLFSFAKILDGTVQMMPHVGVPQRPTVGDGVNFPARWQPRIPHSGTLGLEPVTYPH